MDDQFRNRLRRYDNGAPLRPRPNAPKLATPHPQPRPAAPAPKLTTAPPLSASVAVPSVPAAKPTRHQREPIPPRQIFERPITADPPRAAKSKANKKARKKRRGGRIFLVLFILLLLAGGAAAGFWFVVKPRLHKDAKPTTPAVTTKQTTTATPKEGKKIRLVAVGDSIAYSSINQAAQSGGSYNYAPMMAAIKPIFDKAAIRVCSQTVPAGGSGASVSGPPTFNAPTQFAKGLEDTGCNVIDMASFNTNDKGQGAIDASVGNFEGHSNILAFAGANRSAEEQNKIRYFTIEGLKFAYLSYTTTSNVANPTTYGVNIYSDTLADAQIAEARKNAGVIIVSMHWGTNQSADIDATQDTIAQHLAAANADIIIGNGPHVIQPVKVLEGKDKHQSLVWFSLGNFLNSQVPVENLIGGMAVMDIDSSTQQLHDPRLLPLYMHYEWTPEQKQRQSEADLLARKNFQIVPLDAAGDLLAKSQNGTTVQAQQDRVKAIVNKFFNIPLITSADL